MQLPDMQNLLVLDPRVPLMLIDQPRLYSRRARTFDIDRINVAGEFHLIRTDAETLECNLKNPRVRLRDADDIRADYHVEALLQPESFRIRFNLSLRIRHHRQLVAPRLQ